MRPNYRLHFRHTQSRGSVGAGHLLRPPSYLRLLTRWFARRVKIGILHLNYLGGSVSTGRIDPHRPDLDVAIKLPKWTTLWRIVLRPDPCLGEAYVDGKLTIERGSLRALIELCFINFRAIHVGRRLGWWSRLKRAVLRYLQTSETPRRARRHVSRHYDLSNAFYRLFLDDDMQYSCAYFPCSCMDLDQAQRAKEAHIMATLLLRPGLRVLDIGCGWGGLGLTLGREAGCMVKGVSLSKEQIALAQQRANEEVLSDHVMFALEDYREITDQFDRIVSVGILDPNRSDLNRLFRRVCVM